MDREAIANALQGKRITNRGMLVPRVEYDDGSQGWGVPGLIMEPVEAWQRLQAGAGDNLARMQQGLPFDPQSAGDAFAVTGAAALGSVAAPKPAGAYVTSGAGKSEFNGNPRESAALSAAVQGEKQGLRFDIPNFSPTTGQARVSVMSGPDEIGHGLFYDLKSARGPDAPDALMLRNVAINKDYQRQGIATAMQREMERRSGKKVVPDDSQLSAAEYARWMKIDPDAVASYVDVGNGQFMPSRSGQAQTSLTTNRGTQSDQSLIEALRTYLERNTLPEDTY